MLIFNIMLKNSKININDTQSQTHLGVASYGGGHGGVDRAGTADQRAERSHSFIPIAFATHVYLLLRSLGTYWSLHRGLVVVGEEPLLGSYETS
ncbi:hypothetical protein HanPSC8_Chr02g0063701 [Helianthus annuus]|nr:hypothetical protein HanPSC8_Chr02g0063701 [Helianthus annuus]